MLICPETRHFKPSPYMQELAKKYNITISKDCEKLSPNLCPKKKYLYHYRNLQLYIKLGLNVTKFHKAIRFRQSRWLKDFIDTNTEERKKHTNKVARNIPKKINNSTYGRMLMNK